ncbi:MAG: hypothetical protein GY918_03380, partial [Gammaproteobacteria bacterium]|nr:hypothetical protein [Gammaproteobacteria bacterium]
WELNRAPGLDAPSGYDNQIPNVDPSKNNFGAKIFGYTAPATATLKIYANDGDSLGGFASGDYGANEPGTLLYKSGTKPLVEGFQTVLVSGINVDLPEKVTWTVEFGGVTGTETDSGNRAALILGGTDITGSSLDDFWMRSGSDWSLYKASAGNQGDGDFAANVIAYDPDSIIVKYVPTSDYIGSDSFAYEVIDGNGGSDTATVNISVGNNNIPVADDSQNDVVSGESTTIDLNVSDKDNGDVLSIIITDLPDNGRIDQVVYNSQSSHDYYYDAVGVEVGDEVDLDTFNSSVLTSFDFEYWSDISAGQAATGLIRIYSNDGDEYAASKMPGRLLYQSKPINIANGQNTVLIDDILLVVPDTITWTFGVTTSDDLNAGVIFSGSPSPGKSFDDFWLKTSGGWELNRGHGLAGTSSKNNFSAKVYAYDTASPSIVYTSNPGFEGSDSVTYKVLDGKGGETVATAYFNVQKSFFGLDGDMDGLPDGEEALWGTDPAIADTDGDGFTDGDEVFRGSDPTDRFSKPFFSAGGDGGEMPSLTQEPTSQRVLAGASAAFTVRATPATSGNTLEYHWQDRQGSTGTTTSSSSWVTFPFNVANASAAYTDDASGEHANAMTVTVVTNAVTSAMEYNITGGYDTATTSSSAGEWTVVSSGGGHGGGMGGDPNAGGGNDPNAGGSNDPNAGGSNDPNAGGSNDPNAGGSNDP